MAILIKLVLIVGCVFFIEKDSCDGAKHQSIYKGLHDHILSATGSNNLLMPTKHLPISVGIQVGVVSIHNLDRYRNKIDVTRWTSLTWKTDMTWNPADFSGLQNISMPLDSVWTPDVHMYNGLSDLDYTRPPSLVLFANGFNALFANIRSTVHCEDGGLEFDRQQKVTMSCALRIGAWGWPNDQVRVNEKHENPFDMNEMLAGEEFRESRYHVTAYNYTKRSLPVGSTSKMADYMEFRFLFVDKKEKLVGGSFPGPFRAVFQWGWGAGQ